jgi:hypothetical protein
MPWIAADRVAALVPGAGVHSGSATGSSRTASGSTEHIQLSGPRVALQLVL